MVLFLKDTKKEWHSISVKESLSKLKTSKNGLDEKEVLNRRKIFGKNILPKKRGIGWFGILLNQLKSPLVYILLVAGSISLLLSHNTDAIVIFFTVAVNTFFGFWQENKANNAIANLRAMVKQEAVVLRGKTKKMLDSSELVPGDIIFLRPGSKIPADARLISSEELSMDESMLTGESVSSKKTSDKLDIGVSLADRENMVYMGTLSVSGEGIAVVVSTGRHTEAGKIAGLIENTEQEQTPLQNKINKFSKSLAFIILFLSFAIFVLGILVQKEPVELFLVVTAIAVAVIPEGLLVSVTIILTFGTVFILKKKALVRRLVAAETLGSVSIICTDKTGTLTEGKMQVSKIIILEDEKGHGGKHLKGGEIEKERSLISKISMLCSSAIIENEKDELSELKIIGDPTEKALVISAIEAGFRKDALDKEYPKLDEILFDSQRKYMATLHEHSNSDHQHIFVKGAPEKVLSFCGFVMDNGVKKKINKKTLEVLKGKYEKLTLEGLRLLGVAYKTKKEFNKIDEEINDLIFLGFIALKDPLRPEAKEAIQKCKKAGIRPIIITGDHHLTAKAIFKELGLEADGNVVEGKDLDGWSDDELKKRVKEIDIYARVEPRHKLRIVDAWQSRGEVVAMLGDGINDAPAIKSADIGVAFGSGSDVTKETADIVLLESGFSIIVSAVEQGRVIFDNIRKVIVYLLSNSFSEMILITASLLFGLPTPILVTQILWVNLVADGLPNIAIALEGGEEGLMSDKPRRKDESILHIEMKKLILLVSVFISLLLLFLFYFLLKYFTDINYIRTIIFAVLGVDSLLYVFSVRTLRHSIFSRNPFDNKYLVGSVIIAFAILMSAIEIPWMQQFFHTVHLGWQEWLLVVCVAVLHVLFIEIAKHNYLIKKK